MTPFIGKLKQWIRDNRKRIQIQQGGVPGQDVDQSSAVAPTEPVAKQASQVQVPAQQTSAASSALDTAPRPPTQANGDSATLLALLQGSNARPAPPPAPSMSALNHVAHGSAAPYVPLSGQPAPAASSRVGHYGQPSDTEQNLIQQLQNQHLSGPSGQSPLPAPKATKSSSGTLKLLEMLSPTASAAQASAPSSADIGARQRSGEEDERAKKREALLRQLMGGDGEPIPHRNAEAGNSLQHQSASPAGYSAPQSTTATSNTFKEASLLAMLQNGDQSRIQFPQQRQQPQQAPHFAPPPPTLPLEPLQDHRHHNTAAVDVSSRDVNAPYLSPQPPSHAMIGSHSPDVGRASLLAMLNAGPVASGGDASQGYQQQPQMHHQPMPYPHHMPGMPLPGPPPSHFQGSGLPPWQQYPQHTHGPHFANPAFSPGSFPPMAHLPPGQGHQFAPPQYPHGQFQQHPYGHGPGTGLPAPQNGAGQFGPPLPLSPQMQQHAGGLDGAERGPAPTRQNGNSGGLLALLNGS